MWVSCLLQNARQGNVGSKVNDTALPLNATTPELITTRRKLDPKDYSCSFVVTVFWVKYLHKVHVCMKGKRELAPKLSTYML